VSRDGEQFVSAGTLLRTCYVRARALHGLAGGGLRMVLADRGHPRTPFTVSRMRTGEESERGGETTTASWIACLWIPAKVDDGAPSTARGSPMRWTARSCVPHTEYDLETHSQQAAAIEDNDATASWTVWLWIPPKDDDDDDDDGSSSLWRARSTPYACPGRTESRLRLHLGDCTVESTSLCPTQRRTRSDIGNKDRMDQNLRPPTTSCAFLPHQAPSRGVLD
jgi:hypothetical protein